MKNIRNLFVCLFAVATLAFSQTVTTSTTLATAMGARESTITLTSSTGVLAQGVNNQVMTAGYVDREYFEITSNANSLGTGNIWNIRRFGGLGAPGSVNSQHLSGATVWLSVPGTFDQGPNDRVGSCANVTFQYLPLIEVRSGNVITCNPNNKYSPIGVGAFWVPPTQCTSVGTGATATNTYVTSGTGNTLILNASLASAGSSPTVQVSCVFQPPTSVSALRGAVLQDITMFAGSATTVPAAVATATLGTITFPVAANAVQTPSVVAPVSIGGTVTTVGIGVAATSGYLYAVTTAGAYYSMKSTFSAAVDLSTDLRVLSFGMVFTETSSNVTVVQTPGLLVHYYYPLAN